MKKWMSVTLKSSFVGLLLVGMLSTFWLAGCDHDEPTSEEIQNKKQEQLNLQAVQSVGMPGIVNYAEKRTLKEIFEKRDQSITTVTYTQDMNGHLHKFCDSIGYGIPYATQFTNPQQIAWRQGYGVATLPQADPNGLYSPADAEGTWIMCLNPEDKKTYAVYVEPRVVVSPFALHTE